MEICVISIKKFSSGWKRKKAKKVVQKAKKPLFANKVLKRRQPVQFVKGFPKTMNRYETRTMNKHAKKDT